MVNSPIDAPAAQADPPLENRGQQEAGSNLEKLGAGICSLIECDGVERVFIVSGDVMENQAIITNLDTGKRRVFVRRRYGALSSTAQNNDGGRGDWSRVMGASLEGAHAVSKTSLPPTARELEQERLLALAKAAVREMPQGQLAKEVSDRLRSRSPEELEALARQGAELSEQRLAESAKDWVRKK